MESPEHKEILYSSMMHAPVQTVPIRAAVARHFDWVMLSHRWESKELLLHDVQGKPVYDLDPVGTTAMLQTFCQIARDAGHHWAWSDTCCIDQNNNVELQRSVNSMFVWYRQSALTIVYLSDVPPSVQSGALANSAWNTRGWTVQEFLAPNTILFYRKDWTPYLNDRSPNHKDSVVIMKELEDSTDIDAQALAAFRPAFYRKDPISQRPLSQPQGVMKELEDSTGIDAQALAAFRPGMKDVREKLQWASTRATTLQEDIAYSLFGIFGVHLPVIYGETKQNALGRLLQEIVAQSGDITALDWVGKSSEFNSCLPAEISSYKPLPCTPPPLSEDRIQTLVSSLQDAAVEEQALMLYTRLDHLSAPRFDHRRLHLPCITFPVTEIRRRRGQDRELCFTYDVKADSLHNLLITTEYKLIQFSPARPTRQTFLLIRPWNRDDLELPDFADDAQDMVESMPESPLDDSLGWYPGDDEPVDTEPHSRELRLIARLGQPFGALLLAQQRGGEYKRIALDNNIIAQVKDMASVRDMMDVRTLEIL
ncbi:uncharacterized protein EDB91DRAFT_1347159 [Suillus paluster]|uniref:uncharacterized protein n=1 Tax=Suillus paluster TaxID=48578 RepID=UPI001B877CA7|nr:uncharacterized protein EDB91DRAFT_1347159 [Suillus paluster]KAG1740206.1 hypothetical protein EDB91DRAFT_1347159 [Suillus paluster]